MQRKTRQYIYTIIFLSLMAFLSVMVSNWIESQKVIADAEQVSSRAEKVIERHGVLVSGYIK